MRDLDQHLAGFAGIALAHVHGAHPGAVNAYGSSPLGEAVKVADEELVEMLLDAGADPSAPNGDGQTTLMLAARSGSVAIVRMLIEIAVVAPGFLRAAAPPLLVLLAVLAALAFGIWFTATRDGTVVEDPGNPAALRPALYFAVLYAVVVLAVALADQYLGHRGLYAVAALSGLTDADAITLSTARLVRDGALPPDTAARALVIAAMANLVFKGGAVAVLADRRLLARVGAVYAAALAAGALLLLLVLLP